MVAEIAAPLLFLLVGKLRTGGLDSGLLSLFTALSWVSKCT